MAILDDTQIIRRRCHHEVDPRIDEESKHCQCHACMYWDRYCPIGLRFIIILRTKHFTKNPAENEPMPTDPLYKICPLVSRWFYGDGAWYSGNIKNKQNKYGIKLYMINKPNGLVLNSLVYCGGKGIQRGLPISSSQSIKITLRKNRKSNPIEVIDKKLKKGQHIACFNDSGVGKLKWKDKRDVHMVSLEHGAEIVQVTGKSGRVARKPNIISEYNKCLGTTELPKSNMYTRSKNKEERSKNKEET
ncbi:hypothetical protein J437_LFUL018015, partial [Ladona fulva]